MNPKYALPHAFVETQAYLDIRDRITLARRIPCHAMIVGGSGTGKSTALRKLATDNGFFYTQVSDATTKSTACCQRILLDAGLDPSKYARDLELQIVRMLETSIYDDLTRVLILDEAQELLPQTIKLLMDAAEKACAALVFAGNEKSLVRSRNASKHDHEAISNRIGIRHTVDRCTEKDCEKIALAHSVEGMDAFRACMNYGSRTNMHQLRRLLLVAREMTDSKTLRLRHLENAALATSDDGDKALSLLSPVVTPIRKETA